MYYVNRCITIVPADETINEYPIKVSCANLSEPEFSMPNNYEATFNWSDNLGNVIKQVDNCEVQPEVAYMQIPEVPNLEICYDPKTGCATVHYHGFKTSGLLAPHREYKVLVEYEEYIPKFSDMLNKPFSEVVAYAEYLRRRMPETRQFNKG